MPIPKFNRTLVREIAEAAGVREEAVWITSPTANRIRVVFWTLKMTPREYKSLTGRSRFAVVAMLEDYNADGFLTKVSPEEAKPKDLHPLKPTHEGRKFCSASGCDEVLYTDAELYIGRCAMCEPK